MKIVMIGLLYCSSVVTAMAGCKLPQTDTDKESDAVVEACLRKESFRLDLQELAMKGNVRAASLLAEHYLNGSDANNEQAKKWLTIEADIRGGKRPIILGQLLLSSSNATEVIEGVRIIKTHAVDGNSDAALLLADHMAKNTDVEGAKYWYEKSAMKGNVNAMMGLAKSYGESTDKPSQAFSVLWTLVASKEFKEGTFRHKQLIESALSTVAKIGTVSFESMDNAAILMSKIIHETNKKP